MEPCITGIVEADDSSMPSLTASRIGLISVHANDGDLASPARLPDRRGDADRPGCVAAQVAAEIRIRARTAAASRSAVPMSSFVAAAIDDRDARVLPQHGHLGLVAFLWFGADGNPR